MTIEDARFSDKRMFKFHAAVFSFESPQEPGPGFSTQKCCSPWRWVCVSLGTLSGYTSPSYMHNAALESGRGPIVRLHVELFAPDNGFCLDSRQISLQDPRLTNSALLIHAMGKAQEHFMHFMAATPPHLQAREAQLQQQLAKARSDAAAADDSGQVAALQQQVMELEDQLRQKQVA